MRVGTPLSVQPDRCRSGTAYRAVRATCIGKKGHQKAQEDEPDVPAPQHLPKQPHDGQSIVPRASAQVGGSQPPLTVTAAALAFSHQVNVTCWRWATAPVSALVREGALASLMV